MSKFGEIMGPYEDIMDKNLPTIATGDISVVMKLRKNIPSFLPMFGKKIRITYRGMQDVCANCYGVGHQKSTCKNHRTDWLDYVKTFRGTGKFEDELFGSWIKLTDKRRHETRKPKKSDQNEAKV